MTAPPAQRCAREGCGLPKSNHVHRLDRPNVGHGPHHAFVAPRTEPHIAHTDWLTGRQTLDVEALLKDTETKRQLDAISPPRTETPDEAATIQELYTEWAYHSTTPPFPHIVFAAGYRAGTAESERLRGLLKTLEWGETGCPVCENHRASGHTKTCGLDAALCGTKEDDTYPLSRGD